MGEPQNEEQQEEYEVLMSIYEGDPKFKSISLNSFQYIFGEEGSNLTVLLEIQWPPEYPNVLPVINLNAFYNNHISSKVKSILRTALEEECAKSEGCQQTFTLIEWARENVIPLIENNSEDIVTGASNLNIDNDDDETKDTNENQEGKVKIKKEQLTKSQKRREWDRTNCKGERPRGYDWVDIVKHLSQTGGKPESYVGTNPSQPS